MPTALMGTWRNPANGQREHARRGIRRVAGVISAFARQISVGMIEADSNVLFAVLLLAVAWPGSPAMWRRSGTKLRGVPAARE